MHSNYGDNYSTFFHVYLCYFVFQPPDYISTPPSPWGSPISLDSPYLPPCKPPTCSSILPTLVSLMQSPSPLQHHLLFKLNDRRGNNKSQQGRKKKNNTHQSVVFTMFVALWHTGNPRIILLWCPILPPRECYYRRPCPVPPSRLALITSFSSSFLSQCACCMKGETLVRGKGFMTQ